MTTNVVVNIYSVNYIIYIPTIEGLYFGAGSHSQQTQKALFYL